MNYGGLDKKHTFFIYDNGSLFSQFAIKLNQQGHEVYYYTPFTSNVYFKEYAVGLNIENVQKPLYFFEKLLKYKKEDITIMFPDVGMGDLAHFLKQMGYAVFAAGRGDILEFHREWLKKELVKLGLPVMDYAVIEGISALKNYLKKKNGERVVKLDIFRADAECVDEKTEIFTDKGWRFFYQLTPEDKVLTMNPITRETFFVKPKKIINSFYKGKMYQIKTKKVDLLITPNHHLFVHNNYKNKRLAGVKKLKYRKVADLVKNLKSEKSGFTLPVYFKWKGINKKFYIIKSIKKQNHHLPDKNKKIPMNLWLQFLGWFLSEGCLSEYIGKNKYKYRIVITQSKNKNLKKWSEIKELLNKLGYNYQIERNVGFSIYNKSLFYELINTCYLNKKCEICGRDYCSHNKKVPDYVKELSSSQIKTFLDAFQKGDGCINNGEIRYYSSSKKLINDLQELVFKVGKIGSIRFRKKRSHFRNRKIIQDRVEPGQVSALSNDAFVSKNKIKEVDYKGFIYDVVVEPYHTILLRRNYKVVWSGNSWFAQDVNKIDLKLNKLVSKFGPFAEEYFFIVEEKIEGDEEPGFDLIFNSEDYIKPYLWGYEIAKGPYCGVCDLKPPKVIQEVMEKLKPLLKKMDWRGFISTEMRIKNGRPYLVDVCSRAAHPLSLGYVVLYENFAEIIYKVARKIPVEAKTRGRFYMVLPIEIDSAVVDEWQHLILPNKTNQILQYDKETYFAILTGSAAKVREEYYHVPSVSSVIAVIVGVGDNLEKLKKGVKVLAQKVEVGGEKVIKIPEAEIDEAVDHIKGILKEKI